MSKSEPTKSPDAPEHNYNSPTRGAAGAGAAPTSAAQLAAFQSAMKFFHARQFQEACELFLLASKGPERDIANRARMHLTMCEQRLQQVSVTARSPEEHYTYGIALINTRKLGDARTHLEKALESMPDADHVHYALALAQALDGDHASAQVHLQRAIELEPRNRLIARQDADFAPLASQPPFDALIYPEKKNW